MDKAQMMREFERMNTAGLQLEPLWQFAHDDEQTRRFRATWRGYSVGLSSGTSGQRGLFVASARERAQWAGTMLASLLPELLPVSGARKIKTGRRRKRRRERVALFLRSGNSLYAAVRNPLLSFTFFDLFEHFERQWPRLEALEPTVIVAPAQVLRALALACQNGRLRLPQARVVSVAEVLGGEDRALLAAVFGQPDEVYQATEGFLGVTCAYGNLHLNEAYMKIEPEWLDAHRFVPIVTDFTRRSQPIVRYRLDDVLQSSGRSCPCGNPSRVIDAIEGRCNDMLLLPGKRGDRVQLFADVVARALARALPRQVDWRLRQVGENHLFLAVDGSDARATDVKTELEVLFARQGVCTRQLRWCLDDTLPVTDFIRKRRRITREPSCG